MGGGPGDEARLADAGVSTIGQLAQSSPWAMERLLGRAVGRKLTALAWNRDPRVIQTQRRARSAGAQSALGRRPATSASSAPSCSTWPTASRGACAPRIVPAGR